jgi:cell division protein FtsW
MNRYVTMVGVSAVALTLLGITMVYSATGANPFVEPLLTQQCLFAGFGLFVMLLASLFKYQYFATPFWLRLIVIFSIFTLIIVLIPGIGTKVGGGMRWLRYGGFGFQPSEFAKFALIVLLAYKLNEHRNQIHTFKGGILPAIIVLLPFLGLVYLEQDLGVPAMMIGTAGVMLFVAGVNLRYALLMVPFAALAIGYAILFEEERLRRFTAFLDPWKYRDNDGWQLIQSITAFGRGGLLGTGAGQGEQKLGYLPAAHTDFIFATIGEELGLIGTGITIALFVTFAVAGYRIAMNAPDRFGSLLATGITTAITLQAAFIMMVTTGLAPTKGLPLPFISYGGTSIVVMLGMTGVLMNIGAYAAAMVVRKKVAAPETVIAPTRAAA